MKKIYLSEPNEVCLRDVNKLLKRSGYSVINGDTKLSQNLNKNVETLMIRSYTNINGRVSSVFPNLKNIVRIGVGLDNIDLDYCKQNGIHVFNSAGANSNAVAEYVVGMTLLALRKFHLVSQNSLELWNRQSFMTNEIGNKTFGLVGFGNIAKLVYLKMKALGCNKFYVYDPYVKVDKNSFGGIEQVKHLASLLKNSDIVSLHLPLTKETYHLIDEEKIEMLKVGSILINSSRGAIVCENDVVNAVKNNRITYIADVFENEPRVNKRLTRLKGFIGTPHIASMTFEANENMVKTAIDNFINRRFLTI